ncbi:hypothetical protein NLU13_1402 [Sarocladium strictum]|uniref:Uncharacterized protein n=1 Tax=Sarocladium strictum TaxID=5046 RepID=A0AA39GRN3_SARSR|nr:hypothetical protein NLU13_1402 [Sarocladium strictum]
MAPFGVVPERMEDRHDDMPASPSASSEAAAPIQINDPISLETEETRSVASSETQAPVKTRLEQALELLHEANEQAAQIAQSVVSDCAFCPSKLVFDDMAPKVTPEPSRTVSPKPSSSDANVGKEDPTIEITNATQSKTDYGQDATQGDIQRLEERIRLLEEKLELRDRQENPFRPVLDPLLSQMHSDMERVQKEQRDHRQAIETLDERNNEFADRWQNMVKNMKKLCWDQAKFGKVFIEFSRNCALVQTDEKNVVKPRTRNTCVRCAVDLANFLYVRANTEIEMLKHEQIGWKVRAEDLETCIDQYKSEVAELREEMAALRGENVALNRKISVLQSYQKQSTAAIAGAFTFESELGGNNFSARKDVELHRMASLTEVIATVGNRNIFLDIEDELEEYGSKIMRLEFAIRKLECILGRLQHAMAAQRWFGDHHGTVNALHDLVQNEIPELEHIAADVEKARHGMLLVLNRENRYTNGLIRMVKQYCLSAYPEGGEDGPMTNLTADEAGPESQHSTLEPVQCPTQ